MCLLILIPGADPEYPILVGSNRDERRDRPAAPPGLFLGERRRILSPRDRRAGGTWIAIADSGLFAGLTNLAGVPVPDGARSRGEIPHLALDADDVDGAVARVRDAVAAHRYGGFQLVVSDGALSHVVAHRAGELDEQRVVGEPLVISNEHRLGELSIPGLGTAAEPALTIDERLDRIAALLLDEGARSGHRILKLGGDYGTVSSSLLAVPRDPTHGLVWRYAPGPPSETSYRNYGNLGRRLAPGDGL
ncbi:MAG: NRDE family protein [Planctomycetes bacterium]|nr:NRDE family protein [Planctomycetota bacterium]